MEATKIINKIQLDSVSLNKDGTMSIAGKVLEEESLNKLFNNKGHYLAFKKRWAELAQEKRNTPVLHLLYNLLRDTDPEKGFGKITRQSKLDNGHNPYNWGYYKAKLTLKLIAKIKTASWVERKEKLLAEFGGTVTDEMFLEVMGKLE